MRPERPDLRLERPDLRPERTDLGPEGGGTNKQTNKQTDERKSPCVLQDFVPFQAATQKAVVFVIFVGIIKNPMFFSINLCKFIALIYDKK